MKNSLIESVWNSLTSVNTLSFESRPAKIGDGGTDWNAQGNGTVESIREPAGNLLFAEEGSWHTPDGEKVDFTNTYRWCRDGDRILMQYLRHRIGCPVYLFDLIPDGENRLVSDRPYLCAGNRYLANLQLSGEIQLTWQVVGPTLDERIVYHYGHDVRRDPAAIHQGWNGASQWFRSANASAMQTPSQ